MGTEDYIAPEVIKSEKASFGQDLWSLGVIAYQLFTGKTPFKCNSELTTFERILACKFEMPSETVIPKDAQDFISRLLKPEPS